MSKDWATVADVCHEFGLSVDPTDCGEVSDALRRKLVDLHPDRTGGDFENPADKERYHGLQDALAYVESRPTAALVPIDQIPGLIKVT